MKLIDSLDVKQTVVNMVSVSAGSALQGESPGKSDILIENLIYSVVYAFLAKRNVVVDGKEGKYYVMAYVQSFLASGIGKVLAKVMDNGEKLTIGLVAKDGLLKYIEVAVGTWLEETFLGEFTSSDITSGVFAGESRGY
jgi:hypothetical protein